MLSHVPHTRIKHALQSPRHPPLEARERGKGEGEKGRRIYGVGGEGVRREESKRGGNRGERKRRRE